METFLGSSSSRITDDHTKFYTEFNVHVILLSILLALYLLQFIAII